MGSYTAGPRIVQPQIRFFKKALWSLSWTVLRCLGFDVGRGTGLRCPTLSAGARRDAENHKPSK